MAAYQTDRRRTARPHRVPTTEAVEQIRRLRRHGMGVRQIARQSGVAASFLWFLLAGRYREMLASTQRRLLAVTPRRANGVATSSWKTRRLVEALVAEGFTPSLIRRHGPLPRFVIRPRDPHRKEMVRVKTERAMSALHASLTN